MSQPAASSASAPPPGSAPPDAARLRGLDARVVRAWRLRGLLWLPGVAVAVLVAATVVADQQMPAWLWPVGAVAVLATLATVLIAPRLRYRAWGFAVREADVFLRHGVVFRTTSIVPYARIQHVDTRRGPLARWLGLADLVIFTAGVRGAVLMIPGLEAGEAESLRDRLAALSGLDDAV